MSTHQTLTVGNFTATWTGSAWNIHGPRGVHAQNGHCATLTPEQFDRDGKRMMEAWHAGKDFTPSVEFAGKTMDPESAARAKIELLESGHNATLQVEPWERYLAAEEARQGAAMRGALDRVDAEQWPAVVREVFASLYSEPERLEAPAAGAEWISELLTQAEGRPEWSRLRDRVQGDGWAAGVAAATVATSLAEQAKELLGKMPKQDPQRLEEDAKSAEEILGAGHPVTQAAGHAAKAAQAEADQLLATLQGNGNGRAPTLVPSQVAAALGKAAEEAGKEVGAIVGSMGDMAGLGTGALRSVTATPDAYRKALTANPKLRKVAELAGRLRIRARAKQRTKVKYVPESIVDVTIGGEIERLLPVELGGLVMPETELLLLRKLTEREALQYEMEGEEELDRGPVILAVDGSGSMAGIRNEWAMAVAIAVLEIAAMQRRPFVLMHFDHQLQKTFTVEKPSALKLDKLIEMVSFFSNGGTDFCAPLKAATEIIQSGKQKNGMFARADVMLVTDGQAGWGTWPQALKATGASLYGVAIDCKFNPEMEQELTGCAYVGGPSLHDGSADVDLLFGI